MYSKRTTMLVNALLTTSIRGLLSTSPSSSTSSIHRITRQILHRVRPSNPSFRMSSTSSSDESNLSEVGRVALLQFRVTESKAQNHETAMEYLSRAAAKKARMAVLPEIWNGPYATTAFSEYAEVLPEVGDAGDSDVWDGCPSAKLLREKAIDYNMWIVGGSIPERVSVLDSDGTRRDEIYNTCLCISPEGEIVAKHRKVHLFDIDVPGKITFKESDTLNAGEEFTTFDAGHPFGRVGIGICYDIRFPEMAQCMIERGCNLLIYPGAFNLITGPAHWELLQRGRAVDGQCYVLTASPARSDPPEDDTSKYPHYSAWGHSTAVSPWGEIIATTDEKEGVVIADLDMDKVREMRQNIPVALQKRPDLYSLTDVKNNPI